ncbi:hypothetical protein [uncultured Prevotella sp.]|uniref:hypothetical protein n=1 Tax=uncultured Prevotella sp. TaxID=159272 RepID=UPI0027DB316E|nr:hypothetical protein [uncultured Prevotella sp.]
MKVKRSFTLLVMLFLAFVASIAQNKNEITLVTQGFGKNKEEATLHALRNAIEMSCGTFLFNNSSSLNDELLKDEITTVSSGNVKSYKIISDMVLADGSHSATVKTTISLFNLAKYVKSKGYSVEFDGKAFGMNMKIRELNKENEMQIIKNLISITKYCMSCAFQKTLEVSEPMVYDNDYYLVEMTVKYKMTPMYASLVNYLIDTIKALSLSKEDVQSYINGNFECYKSSVGKYTGGGAYLLERYSIQNNNLPSDFEKLYDKYKKTENVNISEICRFLEKLPTGNRLYTDYTNTCSSFRKSVMKLMKISDIYIRNNYIFDALYNTINKELINFKVVDNLGVESFFDKFYVRDTYDGGSVLVLGSPHGLFKSDSFNKEYSGPMYMNSNPSFYVFDVVSSFCFSINDVLIKKSDIMKYNNFRIENRW